MNTHTDELKTREVIGTSNPAEEEIEEYDLEGDESDLYENAEIFSQKNSIISNVIGDMIENTINGQKTQIDPSPNWFMNTMSGLEELLLEAEEGMDESSRDIMQVNDLIESDGYTCGECGKNCNILEDMKDHLNKSHGHQISLEDTPSVISVKPGEKALKKKVELLEEAMKKLQESKKILSEDKQKLKESKNKEIKKLENERDKYYCLNERSKDSFYRLQGLNVNRIHTVIENNKLKAEAKTSEELLQITLNGSQTIKEENNILKKEIQLLVKEKERLEEQVQPESQEVNQDIEEPENKCTLCEFKTNNSTIMKGHQVKHTIHDCKKCKKQFNSKTSLNQHSIDKHSDNPPVGHSAWADQRNSEPKRCKCSECEESFSSEESLDGHMKTNHSDYSCIQCGEVFSRPECPRRWPFHPYPWLQF